MSWRLYDDTIAGRAAARRFAAAVDLLLDLPRDVIGSRTGLRTETHCRIVRSGTRLAVEIDDVVRDLIGRSVTVRDGGDFTITIAATGPFVEVATLPGWPTAPAHVNPWADRPPRDGLGGAR